jgi:Tfp pilus assembly protein PilO
MKWLPKERRNPFIFAVLVTAVVLAGIYFGLINRQNATLSSLAQARKSAGEKLKSMQSAIKNSDEISGQLAGTAQVLSRAEQEMASGDYYSWTYAMIRIFKQQYKVEIPEVSHPEVMDEDLYSQFPYKQIRFKIAGKAYYHDLGRFVADFENTYPHARIVNLIIEPATGGGEKLSFRMDIIELIKPNAV